MRWVSWGEVGGRWMMCWEEVGEVACRLGGGGCEVDEVESKCR